MSKVLRKVLNIVIDVIVVFIMIVSVLIITLSLTSKSSGVPNLFGYAPLSVQSDSMEPVFSEGDMIISKVSTQGSDTFKVGDIVSYSETINGYDTINTHRISRILENENSSNQIIYTKGDNAPAEDKIPKTNVDILAVYTGTKVDGFGSVLSFLRTQTGFFLCILLPMILFFVYEAIRVILNIIAYNKEKAAEQAAAAVANSELTEEQKQRAIAEYLAQQKAKSEEPKQDSKAEVQTPASDDATAPDPGTAPAEPDESDNN